ncbi:MAG: response regulator [Bacteroidales bacterium]
MNHLQENPSFIDSRRQFAELAGYYCFLKRLGHTSKVADNGKIALGMLAEEDFDAVLMDIEMPVMDGIEATMSIRKGMTMYAIPKFRSLPLPLMH